MRMTKRIILRLVVVVMLLPFTVGGPDPTWGAPRGGRGRSPVRAGGALATGCLVASMIAITVVVPILISEHYRARRTMSVQEVRAAHPVARSSAPAPSTQVEGKVEIYDYQVQVKPRSILKRGEKGEIVSTFDLDAPDGSSPKVEEERVITGPDGKELMRKKYTLKEVDSGGHYEIAFDLSFKSNASQGQYRYQLTLYVDDQEMATADSDFRIVWADTPFRVADNNGFQPQLMASIVR